MKEYPGCFSNAIFVSSNQQTAVGPSKRLLSLETLPLSCIQIGFVCARQHAQKVITLSIFGRLHPILPLFL